MRFLHFLGTPRPRSRVKSDRPSNEPREPQLCDGCLALCSDCPRQRLSLACVWLTNPVIPTLWIFASWVCLMQVFAFALEIGESPQAAPIGPLGFLAFGIGAPAVAFAWATVARSSLDGLVAAKQCPRWLRGRHALLRMNGYVSIVVLVIVWPLAMVGIASIVVVQGLEWFMSEW
mgnify:CR=1 FL=1